MDDHDDIDIMQYPETKYTDIEGLKAYLSYEPNFHVLSINIQSINAKFN
jgi:hypothetical protein